MHNGSGGEPAINNGRPFKDDRAALALSIDRRGLLCMCNNWEKHKHVTIFLHVRSTAEAKRKTRRIR